MLLLAEKLTLDKGLGAEFGAKGKGRDCSLPL